MFGKVTPEQAQAELDNREMYRELRVEELRLRREVQDREFRHTVFVAMRPQMSEYGTTALFLKAVDSAANYILTGKIAEGEAD